MIVKPYENTELFTPRIVHGKYGIPYLYGMKDSKPTDYIGFNYAKTEAHPEKKGLHFYLDDYQFSRVWNNPNTYIPLLKKFRYVHSPDFSQFTDYSLALRIFSHYKKHFIAAYWQEQGIDVIPTICWSDRGSFDWCFDGEPEESVVSVSATGVSAGWDEINAFNQGFDEMITRLQPTKVIYFGKNILKKDYDCKFEFHRTFTIRGNR